MDGNGNNSPPGGSHPREAGDGASTPRRDDRPEAPGGGLRRRLGLGSATALVVGEVIGVGIFLTPAGMARSLGSPAWLLAAWLTMGGIALAGALCFGALAARSPEAGGGYAYLRNALGPRPAFLFGWMSLLVMDPGLTAALATGLATYAGTLIDLDPIGSRALAIGAIAALAAVNILGVPLGARLLGGLTLLKVGLLAFLAAWGFGLGRGDWSNFDPLVAQRPGSDLLPGAMVGALVAAFFSFGGWWDLTKLGGEVRDPARTMPRAMVLGVSIVTIAYVTTSAVFLYLVPLTKVSSDEGFAAQAGTALFGRAGGTAFSMIVIVSVAGSMAGLIMAAPRVYFAMARDGLFFRSLAEVHPRLGTPARAIALQAALASVLTASGTFEQILSYFIVPTVAFLALIVATLYVPGRATSPDPLRPPGYPITPLVFIVPMIALIVLLAMQSPVRSAAGLGIVVLGVPAYSFAYRNVSPRRTPEPTLSPPVIAPGPEAGGRGPS